jgi:hypothetical protein
MRGHPFHRLRCVCRWSVFLCEFGYMDLQRLHTILSRMFLVSLTGHSSGHTDTGRDITALLFVECDTNKHHIEGNRHDRHGLVARAQCVPITGENSGLTMSTTASCPLFPQTNNISAVNSVAEYKIAASTSTRTIGITVPPDAVRAPEIPCWMIQMRYASNPGHTFSA